VVVTVSIAEQLDHIRRAYDAKHCTRIEAIREIQTLVNVTDLGAADLLDHEQMPSVRYAGGAR
jgi:hypothetical protein